MDSKDLGKTEGVETLRTCEPSVPDGRLEIGWNIELTTYDGIPRITLAQEIDYFGPRPVTTIRFEDLEWWAQRESHFILRLKEPIHLDSPQRVMVNFRLVDFIRVYTNCEEYVKWARRVMYNQEAPKVDHYTHEKEGRF